LEAAVTAEVIATTACEGRRLRRIRVEETVFLTPAESVLLRDDIERQRWKKLATSLATAGMRFGGHRSHGGGYLLRRRRVGSRRPGSTRGIIAA
jgi:hypothetical protein